MESTLTQQQLAQLRAALVAKRDGLRRALAKHGRPVADAEREIEDGDVAEQEIALADATAVGEHEHALLEAVEQALAAMDAGTYGRSVATGEPIPFERLK